MKLWKVALLAFLAMVVQDMLGTAMVVSEANFHAWIAGCFDAAQWFAMLLSSGIAIESVIKEGWTSRRSLTIIGAVTAANFVGTISGVTVAQAVVGHG